MLVGIAFGAGVAHPDYVIKHHRVKWETPYVCPECVVHCQPAGGDDPQCKVSERHYTVYTIAFLETSSITWYEHAWCGKVITTPVAMGGCTQHACSQDETGVIKQCYCQCAGWTQLNPPVRDY